MRFNEFKPLSEANLLQKIGQGIAKGANALGIPTKAGQAAASTKIFVKQFLGTLDATQKRQKQMGQPFDLNTFANAYMKKYRWQPGTHKAELDAAIRANNSQQLAMVMDKIGSANTVDPNAQGPELDMSTDTASSTPQQDKVTPQQAQQSTLGVKQINAIVPNLRTRDLNSVKNNIDKTLATRKGSSPVAKTQASAISNMAGQLSGTNPIGKSSTSSTGGSTMNTPSGRVHTSNPSSPNIQRQYQG